MAIWVPMKENPSVIGCLVSFGAADKIVLELIMVEEEMETIPESQQIVPVQQSSETEPLKDTLQLDNQNHEEQIFDHIDATPEANQGADRTDTSGEIPSLVVTHTSHSLVIQNLNFSMQLENVSDDIVAHNLEGNTISVLSPVKNKTLDISSIVAPEGSKIDRVLQKDLDFMHAWLSKAASTEGPFTEVVSKSQKKGICKKFHTKPTLRVLFHRLNEYHFLEHPGNW